MCKVTLSMSLHPTQALTAIVPNSTHQVAARALTVATTFFVCISSCTPFMNLIAISVGITFCVSRVSPIYIHPRRHPSLFCFC
ncbi:hypothetical protein QL285_089775 [Trifolium repens]|nr:hypothetical protein QL285_089775 [Trifolium repens]